MSISQYLEIVEQEFAFHHEEQELFRGHPDRVLIYPKQKIAVIIDRKFGYKKVQPAELNLQLRAYICMVAEVYECDRYYGSIVQPRFSDKAFSARYTRKDIVKSRAEIIASWNEAHKPDAKRFASAMACDFCRAKAICPEYSAWAFAVEKIKHLPTATWTPDQWDIFLSRRGELTKFIDACYEDARRIKAANPEAIPGWELVPGHERRIITDIVGAWEALSGQGILTAGKFSDCCKLALGDLEDAIWNALKDTPKKMTQKQVKEFVNGLFAACIDRKRNEPSLVKSE